MAIRKWRCTFKKRKICSIIKKKTIDSINLTESVKNGFKACGLLPFLADAVHYNILNKNFKNIENEQESSTTITTLNNDQKKYQTQLQFFEQNLNSKILESFKITLLKWSNNIEIQNEGLFLYWIKLKNQSGI